MRISKGLEESDRPISVAMTPRSNAAPGPEGPVSLRAPGDPSTLDLVVEPAPEPTPDAPLSPRPGLKRALLWGTGGVLLLALGLAAVAAVRIGPRNLIGMLLYDQRREGRLQVGDEAPDVALVTLDGEGRRTLASHFGDRPVVLIFGSFT